MQHVSETTEGGWVGHPVIDENSRPVGKVVDVIYDDDTVATPTYAIVGVGMLKSGHYVPLSDAYKTADGRVVVPYDQRIVKAAPKADKNHVMTRDVREATIGHYGMDH